MDEKQKEQIVKIDQQTQSRQMEESANKVHRNQLCQANVKVEATGVSGALLAQ